MRFAIDYIAQRVISMEMLIIFIVLWSYRIDLNYLFIYYLF